MSAEQRAPSDSGPEERLRRRRLDDAAIDVGLADLLEHHPDALVAAVGLDGIFTTIPESLPVGRRRILRARSALDLVISSDRATVIEAWFEVREMGTAHASVHLATYPDEVVGMHFFDVRPVHGVFICLLLLSGDHERLVGVHEAPLALPKVCRIRKDEAAVYTAVDDAALRMLGWQPGELVGHRGLNFIHPDDQARAVENWMSMLASGGHDQRVRLRHQRADGSWLWLEITNHNQLDDADDPCVIGECVDISDEMAAHEAVRAREQLLRRLADALPTGVLQIAPDRSVLYTNGRLHQIVGIGPLARVEDQLVAVERGEWPRLDEALNAVLAGYDRDIELHLCLPATGERRLCQFNFRSLTEDDGSVTGGIISVVDVTESAELRRQLEHRATYDALTGCHNRASVMTAIDAALSDPEGQVAVVFIDLDQFKIVNDDHGHAAGDELLRVVARRLHEGTRDHDVVGRLGGDEFVVVCAGIGSDAEAVLAAGRIGRAVSRPATLPCGRVDVRASVGVARSQPGDTADALVARADASMYSAKSGYARS